MLGVLKHKQQQQAHDFNCSLHSFPKAQIYYVFWHMFYDTIGTKIKKFNKANGNKATEIM